MRILNSWSFLSEIIECSLDFNNFITHRNNGLHSDKPQQQLITLKVNFNAYLTIAYMASNVQQAFVQKRSSSSKMGKLKR